MPSNQGPWGQIIINNSVTAEGGLIPDEHSGIMLATATAVAGAIITLTPPAGKRVRLDHLNSFSDANGVSITVGGNLVVDSKTLKNRGDGISSAGDFRIGSVGPRSDAGRGSDSTIPYLLTKNANDTIVISTDTANNTTVYYAFSYGD